jgi:hypothetical protein
VQADVYRNAALKGYRGVMQHAPDNQQMRASLVNLLLSAGEVAEAQHYARDLVLPLNPFRASREDGTERRRIAMERGRPVVLINTIPKSASESIWNRFSDALGLVQCHVSIGFFPNCTAVPRRLHELALGGISSKEHLAPNAYNARTLVDSGVDKMVVHLRDPRQATLSWAHFVRDEISKTPMGPLWRETCPPRDVLDGPLDGLLDWCIDNYLPQVVAFMQGWQRIAEDSDIPLDILFCTFEAFRTRPESYFDRLCGFYELSDLDGASFVEGEDGHFRKGRVDEWRDAFSREQQERAAQLIGKDLLNRFDWPV